MKNKNVVHQKMPKKNNLKAVWDLVKKDIKDRDNDGLKKYGTRLQAFNGRNSLIDAYQESLDLCVYLRQAIIEREAMVDALIHYADEYPRDCTAGDLLIKLGDVE